MRCDMLGILIPPRLLSHESGERRKKPVRLAHAPAGLIAVIDAHPAHARMTRAGLQADEVAADFERISRGSVLVLGDATLERRVGGERDRHEPAFRLGIETAEPGGAAAVVSALAGFGTATAVISMLGDDLAGAQLTALIGAQANVEPWLLVDGVKATVTETNYVDGAGDVLFRTVREDVRPLDAKLRGRMLRIAGDAMAATSLTVLSDRGHGTLDVEAATEMLARSRQAARRIVADVERLQGLETRYRGFDVIVHLADRAIDPDDAARTLREAAEVGAAVLFLPEGDCVVADRDGTTRAACACAAADAARLYPVFVAGFVGALSTGRSVRRALEVGAYATLRGVPRGTTR